jgi:DNA-binding NarL/FixJ family response regulator
MDKVLSVALVDDHVLFRNGFKMLLENLASIKVVAEGCNGQELLDVLSNQSVDLVFLDIAMPVMDGCVAAQKAILLQPDIKIIILSMYGDESYYSRLFDIGVKGFLLKSSDFSEVTMAINSVAEGGSYISQELMANMVHNMRSGSQKKKNVAVDLSDREVEILIEVCNGLSAAEIADKYFISKRTVEKHRANILLKTNCKNTASLVMYAINNHLI